MKSKLLPVLLIILIVLNGILIFMLIKKPHENRNFRPERLFLTEQLSFTESQKNQFRELDQIHRENLSDLDKQIIDQKDVLFSSFSKEKFNVDSISKVLGDLQGKKDAEVFRFFNKVRKLCTEEQVIKFDKIINQAIKGGDRRSPNREGEKPPREGNRPPRREGNFPR